ncbi:MAG: hypothetical protein OQL09_02290, partial [Gammaproteobacteria bacterium]|nr:hypothetical protein [Gammaproteobacteria bacterium]
GDQIIASKHAINGLCPSLYYGLGINAFPPDSQLLVSEPLTEDPRWSTVDDHSLLVISRHQELQSYPL